MTQATSTITLPSQRLTAEEAVTLQGLFRARIQRSPDKTAFRYFDKASNQWGHISWQDMGLEVARWQAGLSTLNLEPGDRVALSLKNSVEWVTFEQAALGLGLIVIPLYTDDRPDNIAFIVEDAGVKLLLVQDLKRWKRLAPALHEQSTLQNVVLLEDGCEEFIDEDGRLVCSDSLLPPGDHTLHTHSADANALATIVYTSGTTGRPKGVMLSHHNILSIADSGLNMAPFYADDEYLSFLPLSHTLERTAGYYLPMMSGATVAFARSITQLSEDLQTIRPTVLISVPRIYEKIHTRIATQLAKGPAFRRWLFNAAVAVGWHHFEHRQGRRHWHPKLLFYPMLKTLVGGKISQRLGGRLRFALTGGAALSPEIAQIFLGLVSAYRYRVSRSVSARTMSCRCAARA
jgi:long-chain acyl-CoA synthetase